ncbi:MAG TPA: bifunctional riboflavin kinase/FAD synthetase [Terracidiphilus sp.]|jgi:riboflavin kinase/FMN adenylyltransferase|nr:bifunctional riboflavin kinase/FAD synthetase [Terracidiphilus sp.]
MSNGAGPIIPVYRSMAEIPADFGPSVASIGNFDGVHLGHQEILSAVVDEARGLGFRSVAVTFDPHPERFLRPAKTPRLLTTMDERIKLLASTGIDAVVVLPFDASFASLPAQEFVQQILVGVLDVRSLHEGGNFHFGHQARAGVEELRKFGADCGFSFDVHEPVHTHGLEVSSSAIRTLVAAGDMRRARWMLGRPFAMRGTQVRGRGIGARVLVPTVNLAPYEELLPAFGVYVTRLTVGSRCFQAVTNVGNRPTFGEPSFAVESHILDFEPMEMDEHTPIDLEFLLRLRGEIQWPSPEALKAQIFKDVSKAKRYFRLVG